VSFPDRKHLDLLAGVNHIRDWLYDHPNLDTVVHLAAQCGGIGINREKPGEFLYNNLMMTSNLIEACRLEGIRKFVGIGTVCSYPKFAPVPFREDDLYNGYPEETNAPYGQAKRMQLEMLRAYRKQYGFNGIYLIPVNMAGEYDHFDEAGSHVIPALIKKFHDAKMWDVNKPVTLWGDGSASREFLYAGDCAEAIYLAAIRYDGELPVNIGTGQEITIAELATKVQRVVGHKGDILWDETKPNGQPRRCLDTSRAKELFGFEAKTDLDEILARSYTYYLGTLRD
jgi:GDP-L-fucose synthase